jgi:sigma-B regulation protein RsbU (phosphoserine phosphatase)
MVKKHTWSLDSEDAKVYLQNLLVNTSDAIYFKDLESRFLIANDACLRKHGYPDLDACIGKTDADVFSEDHARQALADEQRIIRTGEPIVAFEEKETWPDGHVTWVSTTKVPLRDHDGRIIGTFGISRDITEKKEADLLATAYAAEIQRLKEAMEEEVRMAGELQKAFFPKAYPHFPCPADPRRNCVEFFHLAESSGIVGGDLCSIKRISPSEAGVFLCDVMGHGVRAALGTAIIRSLIEELSPVETDPGRFLAHMNERIHPIFQHSSEVMFITALYLIIDTGSGRIRFASAGHPAPIQYSRALGGTVKPTDIPKNSALALLAESAYETVHRALDPGDTLLLFTDGIYEAADRDNRQFGRQRLAGLFAANAVKPLEEMIRTVLRDVHEFSVADELQDDVCLVGVRWNGADGAGPG